MCWSTGNECGYCSSRQLPTKPSLLRLSACDRPQATEGRVIPTTPGSGTAPRRPGPGSRGVSGCACACGGSGGSGWRVSLCVRRAAPVAAVHVSGDDVPFIIFTATSAVHADRVRNWHGPRAERAASPPGGPSRLALTSNGLCLSPFLLSILAPSLFCLCFCFCRLVSLFYRRRNFIPAMSPWSISEPCPDGGSPAHRPAPDRHKLESPTVLIPFQRGYLGRVEQA